MKEGVITSVSLIFIILLGVIFANKAYRNGCEDTAGQPATMENVRVGDFYTVLDIQQMNGKPITTMKQILPQSGGLNIGEEKFFFIDHFLPSGKDSDGKDQFILEVGKTYLVIENGGKKFLLNFPSYKIASA